MKSINLKVDEALKLESQATCKRLGLSLSGAIKLFLINMNKNKALPFTLEAEEDPFYSKKNQEALEESFKQAERGEVVSFANLEELENMSLEELENKLNK